MSKTVPKLSVILAMTPRSGSYLLCDLLHATGHLPLADEWLTNVGMDGRRIVYGLSSSTSWPDLLPHLLERESSKDGVFAIKAIWNQFRDRVIEAAGNDFADLPTAAGSVFPNARYIWIRRRDRLGQSVSWAKGLQTGKWRSRSRVKQPEPTYPLLFSANDIFRLERILQQEEDGWESFFCQVESQPFVVYYEDLVADPQTVMERICDFLELPGPGSVQLSGSKQRDSTNADWKSRYKNLLNKATEQDPADQPIIGKIAELPEVMELQTGEVRIVEVSVSNESQASWVARIGENGLEGAVVRVDGIGDHPVFGEILEDLGPGEMVTVPLRLVAPDVAGEYPLTWTLVSNTAGPAAQGMPIQKTSLIIKDPPKVEAAKAFFGDYTKSCTGWNEIPWLGFFQDEWFPMICLLDHSFWYVDADGWIDGEVRLMDIHLGWLRASPERPGILTQESDQHQIRLLRVDGETRVFEDLTTGKQFQVPQCLPRYFEDKDASQ